MPIIEVKNITKEFRLGQLHGIRQSLSDAYARIRGRPAKPRPQFKALDHVGFEVEHGEVVGIIGNNGAGKSTLLKMLAGISTPTRGTVAVRGRVAPLIEVGAGLVADLTGRENIYLNAAILGMKRAAIRRRFDEIVAFAELEDFIDTPIKRYSSGMQVRLGFSIATAVESDILIVDEVLAVGDLAFQRKCFDRMEAMIKQQGRTVLLVSHNIRQVERLCSRTILLEHGRIVADGSPRDVCNAFYEASDRRIGAAKATTRPARAESSGDIEIESVLITDISGQPVSTIQYRQDVEFRVTYTVKNALSDPIFGLGIHTTDFLYLSTSQSLGSLAPGTISPGTYTVTYRVADFPFLPGVYSIRVGVALAGSFQPVFYSENVASIQVTSPQLNRAVTSAKNEGFVALEGEWALERIDRARSKTTKAA